MPDERHVTSCLSLSDVHSSTGVSRSEQPAGSRPTEGRLAPSGCGCAARQRLGGVRTPAGLTRPGCPWALRSPLRVVVVGWLCSRVRTRCGRWWGWRRRRPAPPEVSRTRRGCPVEPVEPTPPLATSGHPRSGRRCGGSPVSSVGRRAELSRGCRAVPLTQGLTQPLTQGLTQPLTQGLTVV